jgi:hypothetical protein
MFAFFKEVYERTRMARHRRVNVSEFGFARVRATRQRFV